MPERYTSHSSKVPLGPQNIPWWWPKDNPWAIKNMADAYINNARAFSELRARIPKAEVSPDDAPAGYDNEQASAWASGYNSLLATLTEGENQ